MLAMSNLHPQGPTCLSLLLLLTTTSQANTVTLIPDDSNSACPDYSSYSSVHHGPKSPGRHALSWMRPIPGCRTFSLPEVEDTITTVKSAITDPDLARLFENTFPNTLDTAITFHGYANTSSSSPSGDLEEKEELTFITTGDIPAMWLRDSANQLHSYLPLLKPPAGTSSPSLHSLASLFRGAINLQSRYITAAPYCNAFLPPPEANIPSSSSSSSPFPESDPSPRDFVHPAPPRTITHECKFELDSLAAFLQLSHDYYNATSDLPFFSRRNNSWAQTITTILDVAADLSAGTYSRDGTVAFAPYQFQRYTSVSTETLSNGGAGSPVKGDTGMIRSAFRPSDDACTYQLFVPGNMMFASYLARCADIAEGIGQDQLAGRMRGVSRKVREGVERFGRVNHAVHGRVYAYEVDGFGSHSIMDDANIPSLLSAPLSGYLSARDPIYLNTRRLVLSEDNPYYMRGPVLNSTGGPHIGPGMAWPMGLIVRILTADNDDEITSSLRQLLSSTDGYGLIHEAVNSHSVSVWTRHWFSWANGLFGQMILDLHQRKPHLLQQSFQ